MKKTTINISYDEEKLSALKMYLGQKGSGLDDELVKMRIHFTAKPFLQAFVSLYL